ncbi:MAG: hypothetical protein A3J01_01140 [Candidatus Yanofskybacteria bacterium RIFCSPLOWO2_02_FULL_45_18]|uniref:Methyltransferase domain-containing protein n=1 Tax=Candidatus Yanofskybacteria bacterium RIFCSPLOWO2_02_FULL_45_18 TaxID=1802707 RepID=A0A1F8H4Q3_9BACT|nr:MAG: hypothetical protein A3J01_01140 [Candidatus Yanofskybacteria bacterium RIFCSPLOWO2_02_FULL_45_18]
MTKSIINRGGNDTERLYLLDKEFNIPAGNKVVVKATDIPDIDMADLIARHKGRYYLVGLFCRPKQRVLDFPCGSGYAAEVLRPLGVMYEGLEFDPPTVEYARRVYGNDATQFNVGNLRHPSLGKERYDNIACIEGLEHIEMEYQDGLIAALKDALKPGSVLVVSSPENPTGSSGKSTHNKFHLGELTRADFLALLHRHFEPRDVELVTYKAHLSTHIFVTCFYGICHKQVGEDILPLE